MNSLEAYRFLLPEECIAKFPVEPAHHSRLLRVPRWGKFGHHQCLDLPELLPANSLIVANDTFVVKSRFLGNRESGGRIEALLAHPIEKNVWLSVFKGKVKQGEIICLAGEKVTVKKVKGGGFVELDFGSCDVLGLMEEKGQLPLPPYLAREVEEKDTRTYQTSFAREPGAVAAPTAGLHFTDKLRERLTQAGHEFVTITLHVGPGTFLPVREKNILKHKVPSERAHVSKDVLSKIYHHKNNYRPVVAVGTTVTRTLETVARRFPREEFTGEVSLTISSPHKFRIVDRLCSNFHLPQSSLLLLAAAFSGRERLLQAYQSAVKKGYRFYSYGDLTLLE